jgi:hypothetical protein
MNIHSTLQHHRPPHDGALYVLLKLLPLRYPFTNRQKKILYHTLRNIEANALVTYRPPHDGALYMLLKLLPLRYPFTTRQKKNLYHTLRNIEANALVTYSFPNLLPFVSCFCWFTLPDLALMLKAVVPLVFDATLSIIDYPGSTPCGTPALFKHPSARSGNKR